MNAYKKRNSKLDKFIRRFVPSVATLSYSRLFKVVGYVADTLPNLLYGEFRQLPPAYLRGRVGVGNHLFFNHQIHMYSGVNFWLQALNHGWFKFTDDVVDIGCGCGRKTLTLKLYSAQGGSRFTGTYLGIDIDEEMLAYCAKAFPPPQFRFAQTSHVSTTYSGHSAVDPKAINYYYRIDAADESKDFVFSSSLFTHLLEKEMLNYIEESFRILKKGKYMRMNFFALENVTKGGRWTFEHPLGNAWVESLRYPEAAVAYPESFLMECTKKTGFSHSEVFKSPVQSLIVCRK